MRGFGVARGGSGKLTDALIACIRAHGGEVVAEGPPEAVVQAGTHTGVALAPVLARA